MLLYFFSGWGGDLRLFIFGVSAYFLAVAPHPPTTQIQTNNIKKKLLFLRGEYDEQLGWGLGGFPSQHSYIL